MDDNSPHPNGLVNHFHKTFDLEEVKRLMVVIAHSPERASHILYVPGFLERMVLHILHLMLLAAFDPRDVSRIEPKAIMRQIVSKIRLNNLFRRPLETDVECEIGQGNDPAIQMIVKTVTAHTIAIVETARETCANQPVGSNVDAEPPKPTELET